MTEAVAPLLGRMDQLEAKVDGLGEKVDRLEERGDPIDGRTGQPIGDVRELRDRLLLVEERVDNGFRSIKIDIGLAFCDIGKVNGVQERQGGAIEALQRDMADVQPRVSAQESARGA